MSSRVLRGGGTCGSSDGRRVVGKDVFGRSGLCALVWKLLGVADGAPVLIAE